MRQKIGCTRSDPLKSYCKIRLPFEVVGNKAKSIIDPVTHCKQNGPICMMLLVRLYALEEEYDDTSSKKRPRIIAVSSHSSRTVTSNIT